MVRFSVELPEEMAEARARAASDLQSTPEGVLLAAARSFLAERDAPAADDGFAAFMADKEAFRAWLAEGEADAAAGRVVPAEQVFAELDAIVAAARARKGA